jgi:hypothetical protein
MTVAADTNATFAHRHVFLEQAGLAAVYGVAGALHFSIAVAQILLTIAFVCWAALIAIDREPVEVPGVCLAARAVCRDHAHLDRVLAGPRVSLMADK